MKNNPVDFPALQKLRRADMKPLYIFDLDGTLANQMHRRPLLEQGDWAGYFDACPADTPIQPVIEVMSALYWAGADLWIFSGRSERVRAQTIEWLREHTIFSKNDFCEEQVVMRRVGDTRQDDIVKQEMLDGMFAVDRHRLVATFDDRDRVVAMWRRNGIQCFQVAPGDF